MIFEVATIEIMMMILSYEVIIFEVKIYKMMMMQCLCVCHGKSHFRAERRRSKVSGPLGFGLVMMMMMPTCEGAVSADSDFDIGRSP